MSQALIVLLGLGTFSPPHFMHIRMFEIAKDHIHTLDLGTVVGGIISPVHDAYGKKGFVAAEHRIAMLKLAARLSPWVKVSQWETEQSGWTRSAVTLQYHQDRINEYINDTSAKQDFSWLPDDILNRNIISSVDGQDNSVTLNGTRHELNVRFLCGADLLESFATPGVWSDEDLEVILGRFGLVVVSRDGGNPERIIHESDILDKYKKNVILVRNYSGKDISSTEIRRLLRRGQSAKYLLDEAVQDYINQNGLFGSNNSYCVENCRM